MNYTRTGQLAQATVGAKRTGYRRDAPPAFKLTPIFAPQKIDGGGPEGAEKAAHLQGVARAYPLGDDAHPKASDGQAPAEDQGPNAHQPSSQVIGGFGLDDAVTDGKKQDDTEPREEKKEGRADRVMHGTEKNDESSINARADVKRLSADDTKSLAGDE